jgi:hypothetical protein
MLRACLLQHFSRLTDKAGEKRRLPEQAGPWLARVGLAERNAGGRAGRSRFMERKARQRRRGNAYVEFALVFILLITLMVAAFEFTWVLFIRATFHHAAREAVRAAITANPPAGYSSSFDDYLKSVIKTNTLGLISDAQLDEHVAVEYFRANCAGMTCPIDDPEPGSIVKVSILCYEVFPITSLIQSRDPGTGQIRPFTVNITSSDKVEPFPGAAPARGTKAVATACTGT